MKLTDYQIGIRLACAFGSMVPLSVASAGLALEKLSVAEQNIDDISGQPRQMS